MALKPFIVVLLTYLILACSCNETEATADLQKHIKIEALSESVYKHISYLNTESFGKVACNGMVVISEGEAIVIDCPTSDSGSLELINWIEKTKELSKKEKKRKN